MAAKLSEIMQGQCTPQRDNRVKNARGIVKRVADAVKILVLGAFQKTLARHIYNIRVYIHA